MTLTSTVSRRRFLRMSSALPMAGAALHGLPRAAFAATAPMTPPQDAGMAILNGNEYFAGPTAAAVEAMHRVSVVGNRYLNEGTSEFSKQVAAYHGLKPEFVTLYTGSSDPLRFTVLAFTSPTRSLVTADPVYELAWGTAKGAGVTVHRVPLKTDYSYDMKAMVAADPNAGLYYLCNPNNPTGVTIPRAEIEWLLKNKPAGSMVLVDEAYIHFSGAESVIDLVAKGEELVVIRSFSKIYSMAGLRFGYAMARPDLMAKLHVYGINHVPTTSVQCAKAQLEDAALVPARKKETVELRERTFAWLAKRGFRYTPSDCNHFLFDVRRPGGQVAAALAQKKVMIGRSWASMPNWCRITIASSEEMGRFQQALVEVMAMPEKAVSEVVHPWPEMARERC